METKKYGSLKGHHQWDRALAAYKLGHITNEKLIHIGDYLIDIKKSYICVKPLTA